MAYMVMAAAKFPEEAAKVRTQLDSVIGPNRRTSNFWCADAISSLILPLVPTFDDLDSLPRVRAFFWETFRWRYELGGRGSYLRTHHPIGLSSGAELLIVL